MDVAPPLLGLCLHRGAPILWSDVSFSPPGAGARIATPDTPQRLKTSRLGPPGDATRRSATVQKKPRTREARRVTVVGHAAVRTGWDETAATGARRGRLASDRCSCLVAALAAVHAARCTGGHSTPHPPCGGPDKQSSRSGTGSRVLLRGSAAISAPCSRRHLLLV